MAAAQSFEQVILAVFFGKAVKMAQAIPHTHASSARLVLEKLARWTLEITGNAALANRVAQANTARQVFDMIKEDYPEVIGKVGREIVKAATAFGGNTMAVGVVIFGFDGTIRYRSPIADM